MSDEYPSVENFARLGYCDMMSPGGLSTDCIVHYGQLLKGPKTELEFKKFDYGSKKKNQAHANDIVATLHNRSRLTYGDYLEQNTESTDIIPINASQFQSIRIRSYNPNFQLIPNQHLPSHVELNVYCDY